MVLVIAVDLQDQLFVFKRLIDFLNATIDQLASQFSTMWVKNPSNDTPLL